MRPADERPRRPVGLRCHAASVYYNHFRVRSLLHAMPVPGREQAIANRLAIRARRPASEVFHVKARHLFQFKGTGIHKYSDLQSRIAIRSRNALKAAQSEDKLRIALSI